MDFTTKFNTWVSRVEMGIDRHLPPAAARPPRLHEAMRYTLQAGGKRLRPVLVLAAAELCDPLGARDPLPAAVAIECVHTYSLIHDDLPCLDNDDLRRGRPTAHKAYDEATALLAGDALLTYSFHLLSSCYASSPALATALVGTLAEAAGSGRLIGGQVEDLLAEKKGDIDAAGLTYIHLNKTAAMIEAALVMGAQIGGAASGQVEGLREAGRHLGLAFQILDDILDATGDTATIGKTAGKDARSGKATYVRLHGLEQARELARDASAAAESAWGRVEGDTSFLLSLTRYLTDRRK
ncbi:MAG: polyprenyl synthetase family protein [Opitutaceae bacterium]|nr:polyprenyl synthetase family protein [Opitutaceae bacterium]